jgi:nucleotide-binding universal stress UspA family protein
VAGVYRRILVPLDGSATSRRGLTQAIALARGSGARLRLMHVVDETPMLGMLEEGMDLQPFLRDLGQRGQAILERAKRQAGRSRVAADAVLGESAGGPAADRILGEAKRWRADLIVMGTHGRRGLRHVVLGSEAERVVRRSPVPVLLVRARE